MNFGWPTFKIMCKSPPFSINFRCQIENQVSDYRLLGASSFIFAFCFCIFVFVLSYPMEKLLCESIVLCDFLLIILLIVAVLIDNKAFVCLFVCLFVCTWPSSLVAWCKHFNTKWRGYASFIGQTSALGDMFQSTCVPHVNRISILIYKWVISFAVTKIPCYKLKLNVLLFTQRVYVAMILDILDVNRLHCIFNHLTVTVKKCLCHRWLPICSMVLFVYFIFSCLLLTTIELHFFLFFLEGIILKVVNRGYEHGRTWNKTEFHNERKCLSLDGVCFVCVHAYTKCMKHGE